MANVSVYNIEGKEVGTIDLNDAVFGVEVNEHLVHMAVVSQLANKRQGTQKAKTRSEVSGGGRKPWRQKGTGHARQGSTRSPQCNHLVICADTVFPLCGAAYPGFCFKRACGCDPDLPDPWNLLGYALL